MADQQTRNASPMQACRSPVVSAIAAELKNAMARAVVIRANALNGVSAFRLSPAVSHLSCMRKSDPFLR
jgi:hypothetical protein